MEHIWGAKGQVWLLQSISVGLYSDCWIPRGSQRRGNQQSQSSGTGSLLGQKHVGAAVTETRPANAGGEIQRPTRCAAVLSAADLQDKEWSQDCGMVLPAHGNLKIYGTNARISLSKQVERRHVHCQNGSAAPRLAL